MRFFHLFLVISHLGCFIIEGVADDAETPNIFEGERAPSSVPSLVPSEFPSLSPTESLVPSRVPSPVEVDGASSFPSRVPSSVPSLVPSEFPSLSPTKSLVPSRVPSPTEVDGASSSPSRVPSSVPSEFPSLSPTESLVPSRVPSEFPSLSPTESLVPSRVPSPAEVDGVSTRAPIDSGTLRTSIVPFLFSYSFDSIDSEPEETTRNELLQQTTDFLQTKFENSDMFALPTETQRRILAATYIYEGLELEVASYEFDDATSTLDMTYAGDLLYSSVSDDSQQLSTQDASEVIFNLNETDLVEYVDDYVKQIETLQNTSSVTKSEASLAPSSAPTGWGGESNKKKKGLAWYFYVGIAVIAVVWCVATILLCKDFHGRGRNDDEDYSDDDEDKHSDRQHYDEDCYESETGDGLRLQDDPLQSNNYA